jgi:hypothetical protein
MKKLRIILSVILSLLLILSPVLFVCAYALSLPPVYSETFYGALNEKYARLSGVDGEKIVVVGGSSVAFGLDSALLESYTGMPVVNFGLYADLGTKMMLDLSLSGIGKGDVVILAPELDPQTLSLYFNNESALMALDDDFSMARHLSVDDVLSCVGGMWRFAQDKRARHLGTSEIALDAIYRSEYFNEYGDFALSREENVMKSYYDPNNSIVLDLDGYGADLEEFIDYVNRYVKKCSRRGATVYFSFCPMNALALSGGSDTESRAEFRDYLAESLECELISELDDYILEAGYFFDTNFHLNDAGVKVRTIRLAKDLRIAAGIMKGSLDDEPEAPALPFFDVAYDGENDPVCDYYEFSALPDGSYGISGLTELGRAQSTLTLPLGYNGRKVTALLENAFSGTSAERIVITADSNIVIIHNGAFVGASTVKDLSVYKMDATDIMPPVDFYGVHPDFAVHVPVGSSYGDNYDWSNKARYVYDL